LAESVANSHQCHRGETGQIAGTPERLGSKERDYPPQVAWTLGLRHITLPHRTRPVSSADTEGFEHAVGGTASLVIAARFGIPVEATGQARGWRHGLSLEPQRWVDGRLGPRLGWQRLPNLSAAEPVVDLVEAEAAFDPEQMTGH
jgi:hypothetical protein